MPAHHPARCRKSWGIRGSLSFDLRRTCAGAQKAYASSPEDAATYTYDACGRVSSRTDACGTAVYAYDGAGRLISETDGFGQTLTYAYDEAGALSSITYPVTTGSGHFVTFCFRRTERALNIIGSKEHSVSLHGTAPDDVRASVMEHEGCRDIGDGESIERALALLGESTFRHLKGSPKENRGRAIRILRSNGMPVR